MVSVFKSGTAIVFPVEPGVGGFPSAAHSVLLSAQKGSDIWNGPAPVLWADAVASGITFPAQVTTITEVRQFLVMTMTFLDDQQAIVGTLSQEAIIESENLLRPGINSFGTWGDLLLQTAGMAGLVGFKISSREEQTAALINAYYNIGMLNVDFNRPRRKRYLDQNRINEDGYWVSSELAAISSTTKLTSELFAELTEQQRHQLLTAQIIEADYLLSGYTPEKQRLDGLLSHSAGESAHFYRTVKPLELPVSRKTAGALKGIVSYAVRIC